MDGDNEKSKIGMVMDKISIKFDLPALISI